MSAPWTPGFSLSPMEMVCQPFASGFPLRPTSEAIRLFGVTPVPFSGRESPDPYE